MDSRYVDQSLNPQTPRTNPFMKNVLENAQQSTWIWPNQMSVSSHIIPSLDFSCMMHRLQRYDLISDSIVQHQQDGSIIFNLGDSRPNFNA
jgi:hypothetical protein